MPPVGTEVCLPLPCTLYQIEVRDSCGSIAAQNNITMAQFLAWNPAVSAGCTNLGSWRGRFLCTSSPLGSVAVSDGASVTTEAPRPTDAKQDSNTHCGTWYSVKKGDTCASISVSFMITLADFYFLNPHVDNKCSNLWLDTSYCVKPVGNIQTYPNYPVEVPSTSFPRPTEPTQEPVPSFAPPELNPRAPDTVADCDEYMSAWPQDIIAATPEWNSCDYWVSVADVSVVQLLRWNPSLKKDDCIFLEQYSYCVLKRADMNGECSFHKILHISEH
jgi:LysM repeat protein